MAKSNNATSGNFFDGGNGRNVGLTNDLFDLQEFAKTGELGLLTQGGAMTEEEASAEMDAFHEQNEADRSKAVADVNRQSVKNTVLNVVGLAASLSAGGSALKAAGAKGVKLGEAAASTAAKTGIVADVGRVVKSGVSKLGSKISNSAIAQSVKNGASKLGNTAVGSVFKNGASKLSSVASKVKGAVRGLGSVSDDAARSALGVSDDVAKVMTGKGKTYIVSGSKAVLKGSNLTFNVVDDTIKSASVLGTLKTTFKNAGATIGRSKSVLSAVGNVGKATGQVMVGTTQAAGALASKFFTTAGAKGGLFGKMGNLVRNSIGTGIVTAPMLTTQMVTRSISDEKTAELNGAISVLTDTCEYYEKQSDKLTDQQEKDYQALLAYRDESHAELLEKYGQYIDDEGNFTNSSAQAAFYEDYKNLEQSCADKLEEQSKGWKDFATESTTRGAAMNMAGSMTEHRASVDKTMDASSYIEDKMRSNPDALDKAYEGERINQQLAASGDEGGFWGFINSVHNTILHYLPVMAYAEAAVKKGADVVLSVLPIGYEEKYAGQSIGDLASSISQDAEAAYELSKERKAVIKECDNESDVGFGSKEQDDDGPECAPA